jgi:uncharacterized protein (TIGR02996 family)
VTYDDVFLQAIIESPEDDAHRLVYADWLEEKGQTDRAEFIRVQCELKKLFEGDVRRQQLQARKEQLWWVAHREDWVQQFGVAMTWENALTLFKRRLAETTAWCRNRNVDCLRTPALEPASLLGQSVLSADGRSICRSPSTAEREAIVNDLANRRVKLLAEEDRRAEAFDGELVGGRLLLFDPDGTLSDGAATSESGGFVSLDNVPAWDTWVWYAEDCPVSADGWTMFASYLVAWVPPHLLELADAGIRVNPEECIQRASDVDTTLTRRLRAAGLLA